MNRDDIIRMAREAGGSTDDPSDLLTIANLERFAVLVAALNTQVHEPVAWMHNHIDTITTHRPADLDRHPERWTALYAEPKTCMTCEALARAVMMDQTGHT